MSEFIISLNDIKLKVKIISETKASVNGKTVNYELINLNGHSKLLQIDDLFYEIYSDKIDNEKYSLFINGKNYSTVVRTELQERATKLLDEAKGTSNRKIEVKAPMPGMILKLKKNPGDDISAGESVLILEAMKMENDVKAPAGGKVTIVNVKEGIAVDKGDSLFVIE
jgi:biotin carboxyl carrier protein